MALLLSLVGLTYGQENTDGKFRGNMIGDYYWIAENHDPAIKDKNGFWFRRIYFTYDKKLSDAFSVRFRLEMSQPGDFSTESKITPVVKDAYLKWKAGNTHFILGISPTPTWNIVEKTWGYRSVEKTALDLQKFGSSRDFGAAVRGQLDRNGKVKYHLMLANGSGNESEVNKGKMGLLSLGFYPAEEIIVEVYGDWNDNPGDNDWFTVQGFAAYKAQETRIGMQFAHQNRKVEGREDIALEVGSLFLTVNVGGKTNVFARIDRMFDPNPQGEKISYIPFDPTAKSTFIVAGLDFTPIKNVHLMPNVEVVIYDENDAGVQPATDAIPRFTFYYIFK